MSGPAPTRRAVLGVAPALVAVSALGVAEASAVTPEHNFRRFLEWCDLGPAMDHAIAAGFLPSDIYCVVMEAPQGPAVSSLLLRDPRGEPVTFTNKGRVS